MKPASALLWTVAASIALAGVAVVPRAVRDRVVAPPEATLVPSTEAHSEHGSSGREAAALAAPFRQSRIPAAEAYGAEASHDLEEIEYERPDWVLTGILGSEGAMAIFEDSEGLDDRTYVVAVGQVLDDYEVVVIDGDSVVVAAPDQTWTFRLSAAWR